MAATAPPKNVAIVGATGNLGKNFVEELLKTGKHAVTALTRNGSKGALPDGVRVAYVDYSDERSLVAALLKQDFLIITLSIAAAPDTHSKIVEAAAKAGVPYIMPNAYGSDIQDESLRNEDLYGKGALEKCEEIQKLGSSYVAMACGFWYEWSLALGDNCFGIDIKQKKVNFFEDGNTILSVSTWQQCGRALAALLSLPESGATPSLSQWKNKPLYVASFRVSQRDMLDSVNRVMKLTDKDWTISHISSRERYQEGVDLLKSGDSSGYVKALYSRHFFPNGGGDFGGIRGLANDALGLPKDDLDEATARAVQMVESGWNPFAG